MSKEFDIDSLANMSDEDFLSSSTAIVESELEDSMQDEVGELDSQEESEETTEDVYIEEQEESDTDEELDSEEESDQIQEEDDVEEEEEEDNSDNSTEASKELEKLLSPFNANGTQIKVDSVDEAISLMKMGANYHKKMHTLKPHLRLIKTLENNKLLDEDKVNFLIDLSKGDQKAITKLLSDANINPLDLNTEESNEYSPVKHTVSEQSINLDEVLERIQDTPTFKDTMDVITNQWDSSSKEKLVSEPQRIEVLNAHKASGLFDRINAEVTKSRMLGQIPSTLSDIDAYELVGMRLVEQDKVNGSKAKPNQVITKPKPKTQVNTDKRKLATPKSKKTEVTPSSIESLAELSDDDFLKLSSKYF